MGAILRGYIGIVEKTMETTTYCTILCITPDPKAL